MKKRRVKLGINAVDQLHICFVPGKTNERLRTAFVNVVHLLCEREPGCVHDHKKELIPVSYVLREVGAFDPDVPNKLRELWAAIDAALEVAYIYGKDEGASIVKRLASGEATVNEFNEETIGANDSPS